MATPAFGSLGGLGGLGASYPTRAGAPNSEAVGHLGNFDAWNTDWQKRRDAITGSGGGTNMSYVRPNDARWDGGNWSPVWQGDNIAALGGNPSAMASTEQLANSYGLTLSGNGGQPTVGYANDAGYWQAYNNPYRAPDYSESDAERNLMMPQFENQTRQQQGYDSMRGWGQENGVMGPNYTDPNFGQVNGRVPGLPNAGAAAGIDMSWADGALNPQGASTGVYSPAKSTTRKSFGLW